MAADHTAGRSKCCNGSMPPKTPDLAISDSRCPKCGREMEPIATDPHGPAVQHLQLCPGCYLVMWSDESGVHVRQGVPMRDGGAPIDPGWFGSEPEKC
jgi:hypothetical protein